MDNKVYSPEIIPDLPLPGQTGPVSMVVQQPGSANSSFSPATIDDTLLPTKKIATELLSVALNTRSKKILQEFQFTKSGAIQIGEYTPGVNGDIRITQAGITARNALGDITFAIDGETGDAVFAGIVQARDFVISDENGLVSASVFQSDSYRDDDEIVVAGTQAGTLVAGSELNFTLVRPAKVLITFFSNVFMVAADAFRGYYIKVGVSIDGSNPFAVGQDHTTFEIEGVEVSIGSCLAFSKTFLLDAGQHTISLKWATFADVGSNMYLRTRGLDYCMLGS